MYNLQTTKLKKVMFLNLNSHKNICILQFCKSVKNCLFWKLNCHIEITNKNRNETRCWNTFNTKLNCGIFPVLNSKWLVYIFCLFKPFPATFTSNFGFITAASWRQLLVLFYGLQTLSVSFVTILYFRLHFFGLKANAKVYK